MRTKPLGNCGLQAPVLAWTVAQPGVTHALIGGRNVAQGRGNARGGELELKPADVERMRREVTALGQPPRHVVASTA